MKSILNDASLGKQTIRMQQAVRREIGQSFKESLRESNKKASLLRPWKYFEMNNKTNIEFGFYMMISEDVFSLGGQPSATVCIIDRKS